MGLHQFDFNFVGGVSSISFCGIMAESGAVLNTRGYTGIREDLTGAVLNTRQETGARGEEQDATSRATVLSAFQSLPLILEVTQDDGKNSLEQKTLFAPSCDAMPPFYIRF